MFSNIFIILIGLALSTLIRAAPLDGRADQLSDFDYNSQTVRGVNLGGWLVLEPWITPSLFDKGKLAVDEFSLSRVLGPAAAKERFQAHWNTWIVQADFEAIARAGLNHVRIPIGYWAVKPLPNEPYVQGQLEMLDQAVKWARTSKLRIMLDLHGAPGSQNGFDNSGKLGAVNWLSGDTAGQTVAALEALAARYKSDMDVVTVIELLNEPLGPVLNMDKVKAFYNDGYNAVRKSASPKDNKAFGVVIHDAFKDVEDYWNGFMGAGSNYDKVLLDTHQYQIFTPDLVAQSPPDHIKSACKLGNKLASTDKWTVVGEWTGAQTDCAKWLNGYGKGARYDGTLDVPGSRHVGDCAGKYQGRVADLSADDKFNLRHFIEAQLDAYERHTGWVFWTWKTESAPEWHMQDLLAHGLFPQPLTDRRYPGQCA